MDLFEECIAALGSQATILSKKETGELFEGMTNNFPITQWGQIDWGNVKKSKQVSSVNEIVQSLGIKEEATNDIYILWDNASVPAVKVDIQKALNVLDYVITVSFDTWIYNPNDGYVIEFYHEGDTNIGWIAK